MTCSVVVGFAMTTVLCLFCLPEGSTWKGITMSVNITVASLISCRVFRELRLGYYANTTNDVTLSSLFFEDSHQEHMGHELQVRIGHTGRSELEFCDGSDLETHD
jgi:hypothetical protein